jgi:hypothetical protein
LPHAKRHQFGVWILPQVSSVAADEYRHAGRRRLSLAGWRSSFLLWRTRALLPY